MRRTSLVAAGTVCVALAGVLPALPATAAPVEQLTVYVNPAVATGAGALERGTGRTSTPRWLRSRRRRTSCVPGT